MFDEKMQKKTLPSVQLNEQRDDTSRLYKILKTSLISVAFFVMVNLTSFRSDILYLKKFLIHYFPNKGIYSEIVGLTMPDMKLQFRLYESHEAIGVGLALSSVAILLGCLFMYSSIVFLNFNTKFSAIFSFNSKIDFIMSISFFCTAAGTFNLIASATYTNFA